MFRGTTFFVFHSLSFVTHLFRVAHVMKNTTVIDDGRGDAAQVEVLLQHPSPNLARRDLGKSRVV